MAVAAEVSTLVAGESNVLRPTTVSSSKAALSETVLPVETVADATGSFSGQCTPVKVSADSSSLTLSGSCKVDMEGVVIPLVSSAGNFHTGLKSGCGSRGMDIQEDGTWGFCSEGCGDEGGTMPLGVICISRFLEEPGGDSSGVLQAGFSPTLHALDVTPTGVEQVGGRILESLHCRLSMCPPVFAGGITSRSVFNEWFWRTWPKLVESSANLENRNDICDGGVLPSWHRSSTKAKTPGQSSLNTSRASSICCLSWTLVPSLFAMLASRAMPKKSLRKAPRARSGPSPCVADGGSSQRSSSRMVLHPATTSSIAQATSQELLQFTLDGLLLSVTGAQAWPAHLITSLVAFAPLSGTVPPLAS
mmetsp:Transcript_29242/g.57263  ORF Transcript_29242/g.57263 Transcript_29242/m.57263 type:complete len:362 (-) Transcript_29242:92-1177(-)